MKKIKIPDCITCKKKFDYVVGSGTAVCKDCDTIFDCFEEEYLDFFFTLGSENGDPVWTRLKTYHNCSDKQLEIKFEKIEGPKIWVHWNIVSGANITELSLSEEVTFFNADWVLMDQLPLNLFSILEHVEIFVREWQNGLVKPLVLSGKNK